MQVSQTKNLLKYFVFNYRMSDQPIIEIISNENEDNTFEEASVWHMDDPNSYFGQEFSKSESNDPYEFYKLEILGGNVTAERAKILTLTYNNYPCYCCVFILQPFNLQNGSSVNIYCYLKLFQTVFAYFQSEINNDIELLGVLEKSPTKGYHLHVLMYTPLLLQQNNFNNWIKYFTNINMIYKYIGTVSWSQKLNIVCTVQKIKSNASYVHYLRKNPLSIFSNSHEATKMFLSFNRTFIFPKDSIPKYLSQQKIFSKDKLTILLFNMFTEGILSYDEILKDSRMQCYLTKPNLESVYKNCFSNFIGDFNYIKALITIIEDFLKMPEYNHCACAFLEYITWQGLNLQYFLESLFNWLVCAQKKNCLLFIGPSDTGKSYCARLLWQCFPLHTRIMSDGIFSFANLQNSGCALWDEPFISPELADQTKLVLEGEPDINVTIKGKNSVKLNKRVPIIITSNNELHVYVSKEREAFANRCFRFNFTKGFSNGDMCKANIHYCPNIDTTSGTHNPFASDSDSEDSERRREIENCFENCKGNHTITLAHARSTIVLALLLYKRHINIKINNIDPADHCKLADLLKLCKSKICHCSRTLELNTNY